MFKRILLIFRAAKLCTSVTKISEGISSAIAVINYVIEQVGGSPLGEKVNEVLIEVNKFLLSVQETVDVIRTFTCGGSVEPPVVPASADIDSALRDLKKITADLNN